MPSLRRLLPWSLAVLALLLAAGTARSGAAQEARFPWPELPPATRGPVRVRFSASGDRAYVVECESGTVAVAEPTTGKVLGRYPSGGEQPSDLALLPDGSMLVVNRFSGSVVRLDCSTGARRAAVSLRGEPTDVLVARDGRSAYVSVSALDEVAVLRLPELSVARRIRVGRRPRSLLWAPDRKRLLVAALQSGEVSSIDVGTLTERGRVRLPGRNLRGMALGEDGHVWLTGQTPGNDAPTSDPLAVWSNRLFRLDPDPASPSGIAVRQTASDGKLDAVDEAVPDPDGITMLDADHAAVVSSGRDQVLRVKVRDVAGPLAMPQVERRADVGAHPRSVALSPDGKQLWVTNELDSTISVLDPVSLKTIRRVPLGAPGRRDLRLDGRYVFGSAALTRGGRFTCNSCHPDGGADGLTWRFTHVPDGVERRNTRNLRGSITLTAPFRWSGRESDIEVFFQDEILGLLHGPRQEHETLHALWNIIDQTFLPPNPYRSPKGRLTPAAVRGKRLFEGKAGCVSCHSGEYHGGTGKKAWVGTTPRGQLLDVPHLTGVYDSDPYLHDGSAPTLEAIFRQRDPQRKHGAAYRLTAVELSDLVRYLKEL